MTRRSYRINKIVGTDRSFYSFIGALLVFLGFLLLISLLLYLVGTGPSHFDNENGLGSSSELQGQTSTPTSTQLIDIIKIKVTSNTENNEEDLYTMGTSNNSSNARSSTDSTSFFTKIIDDDEATDIDRVTNENYDVSTSTLTIPTTDYEVIMRDTYCDNSACKKLASNMLYTMNHDGNPCRNFYYYACGRNKLISRENLLEDLYQQILEIADKNQNTSSSAFFMNLYKSCVSYEADLDLNFLSRLNASLTYSVSADLTELIHELIMDQSMPFFDVGLRISNDSKFEAEITLPGLSSLKTSISRWCMLQSIKRDCLKSIIQNKDNNHYDMDEINEHLELCSVSAIRSYVKRYADGMRNISDRFKNPAFLQNLDFVDDLVELFEKLKETHEPKLEVKSLSELVNDEDYNFGLDWTKLFTLINSEFSDNSIIHFPFPTTVKYIFSELRQRQKNITGILQLWKQIQHYWRAMSFSKHSTNNDRYCLSSISELIPDIANALVSQIQTKTESMASNLFKNIKTKLKDSFSRSGMRNQSINILQEKLNQIVLRKSKPIEEKILVKHYQNVHIDSTVYFENCLELLRSYRKRIFSLNGADVSQEILFLLLSPFESRPKSFQPSNVILYQPGMMMVLEESAPYCTNLAKIGLPLAQQIANYFERNYYHKALHSDDGRAYQDFIQGFNDLLWKLTDNATHSFNGKEYNIEYPLPNKLKNPLMRDNLAFRVITDYLQDLPNESLIWLNMTYTNKEVFLTMAAQEHCESTSMLDIVETFVIQKTVPMPIRINSAMKNSKFFREQYNCAVEEDSILGQFPYQASTTPSGPN